MAPHFFVNTVNTSVLPTECNPPRAAELLQHVVNLFGATFNGAREIGFEEVGALCNQYLVIECCHWLSFARYWNLSFYSLKSNFIHIFWYISCRIIHIKICMGIMFREEVIRIFL